MGSLFAHFSVCILMFFLFSFFWKKEQEWDGQKKVTEDGHLPSSAYDLLLPVDFPVPFCSSLVSPNHSSVLSGGLGWDISRRGGLRVFSVN